MPAAIPISSKVTTPSDLTFLQTGKTYPKGRPGSTSMFKGVSSPR